MNNYLVTISVVLLFKVLISVSSRFTKLKVYNLQIKNIMKNTRTSKNAQWFVPMHSTRESAQYMQEREMHVKKMVKGIQARREIERERDTERNSPKLGLLVGAAKNNAHI